MKYSEKLKDPRWQKKRLEIFTRDEWVCQSCFDDKEMLCVHHLYYLNGVEPWDYGNKALLTLCASCHEAETFERTSVESDLLSMLKRNGFLTANLYDIATGFHLLEIVQHPEITARALRFALSDHKTMQSLVETFLNSIPAPGDKNGKK